MDLTADIDEGLEGHVDGLAGRVIRGWVWRPNRPETALRVEVSLDGEVIATGLADRPRADLEQAGKRGGACAFEIDIPSSAIASGGRVEVRVDGVSLPPGAIDLAPDFTAAFEMPPRNARTTGEIAASVDQIGPHTISGWAHRPADPARPVSLTLFDGAQAVLTFAATGWRTDLAEARQGDGRGAFSFPVPVELRDGEPHEVDLRTEDGASVLARPIRAIFPAAAAAAAPATRPQPEPKAPTGAPKVSFIVNFYNMQREAERTLTSLSRGYQRGVEGRAYEVICVDNGSAPPIDEAWVKSFGPEFRLYRPASPAPSPCRAINEAAREARGGHLAVMIDGAHVLTPGILREALDAIDDDPEALVAVRHWFVGGDQRWLGEAGYTREAEDILFSKIQWPTDGYELFRVGSPIGESTNAWFDGLSESNCLFLGAGLYQRLGGMDEGFDEGGGGLSNLDLFRRAADATDKEVVCLLGEATFHQFHEGTTTNVPDAEKDRRVRRYVSHYETVRGHPFTPVPQHRIRLKGIVRNQLALSTRQRPIIPAALGLTDRVRFRPASDLIDSGAQIYLQSAYVESRSPDDFARWLGDPVHLSPGDVLNIQDILRRIRPHRVLTTTRDEGLISMVRDTLEALGLQHSRIVRVLPFDPNPVDKTDIICTAEPHGPVALDRIASAIGPDDAVVVLFEPEPGDHVPLQALTAYARFVSHVSYLVFLGSVFGQPWLGYSKNWYRRAINLFVEANPVFTVDASLERCIVTTCAGGYIQRIRSTDAVSVYDASLDDLEGL